MRIFIMALLLSCLMLGATFQSPCVACEEETENYQLAKKCQRVKPSSFAFESTSLAINQWNTLPEEVWLDIFGQLSFLDLSNVQKVCRHWHTLGRDDTLSLTQQILRKPLSEVLWKLEAIKDGAERLKQSITLLVLNQITCQRFFSSPDAFHKLLLAPTAIGHMLRAPSLFPLLFESELTASEIYQALPQHALDEDQRKKLEAYAKVMPVFPFQQKKFSKEFVNYAKTYSPHYKAFYLLSLFNLPVGKPMKDLLRRINKEVTSKNTYKNNSEDQAIFIPQGMTYFTDLPSDIAYNIGEYSDKWAEQTSNEITKSIWLSFAEFFFGKSANQGDALAQCNLGLLLLEQGKLEEAEAFLRQSASQGEISAQCGLGSLLHEQGKFKEAEAFLREAASQGDATAQCNLGTLLQEQSKLEEAEVFLHQAANQGHSKAQYNLGLHLHKLGNLEEAEPIYRQAASQGHSKAQYNLGVMLLMQGKLNEAEAFLRQSASQGYATAQYNLGVMLLMQGKFNEAEAFLRQVASQGEAIAQYYLGFYLEKGGNFEEAIVNYEKAVKQGDEFSCLSVAYLLETHPELFQVSSAELNHRIAQLREQGKDRLEDWSKERGL